MQENLLDKLSKTVRLSDCENIVKIYKCVHTTNPAGDGIFALTNKRLLFFIDSERKTTYFTEMPIESFSGINYTYGKFFNNSKRIPAIFLMLLGLMFVVFAIFKPFVWVNTLWSGIFYFFSAISFVAGIFFLIKAFTVTFKLEIISAGSYKPFIAFENSLFSKENQTSFVISALPTKQTENMVKELGSLIVDIKKA